MNTWLHQIQQSWPRRWLPFMIGIVATVVVMGLWQQFDAQHDAYVADLVHHEAINMDTNLTRELTDRVQVLERMVNRWEVSGGTPQPLWEGDAKAQIRDIYGFQAIEWVDSSLHVRWIVSREGNESAQNLDVSQEISRRTALRVARDLDQPTFTRTVSLVQGGKGVLLNLPIFANHHFDGFIVGVFKFPDFFDSFFWVPESFSVRIYERDELIYQSHLEATFDTFQESFFLEAYGLNWRVEVAPTPAFVEYRYSNLPTVVLWGGLGGGWLLSLAIYLGQRSERYAQKAKKINQELQVEMRAHEQSEARFRQLVEHINAGIVIHAPDTHITFCQQSLCSGDGVFSSISEGEALAANGAS